MDTINFIIMSLVVFDGIDGSGKSTQVKLLEKRLIETKLGPAKYGVVTIAEPTKSKYGIKIREAMMNIKDRLSFEDELDLFTQDRIDNVETNIIPALKQGKVVILDRYYFSTAAYQGSREGGKLSWQDIIALNEKFAPRPSLVFFFFMPVDMALKRIDIDAQNAKRESRSYMERKDTLEKVQAIFKAIHESHAYNSHAIDAIQSIEQIHEHIWVICKNQISGQRLPPPLIKKKP